MSKNSEQTAYATVCTRPSIFARAKYEPDDPFVIIFGWMPSVIAIRTDCTILVVPSVWRQDLEAKKMAYWSKSAWVITALWSSVLTCTIRLQLNCVLDQIQ
jgi:hypothetical protein